MRGSSPLASHSFSRYFLRPAVSQPLCGVTRTDRRGASPHRPISQKRHLVTSLPRRPGWLSAPHLQGQQRGHRWVLTLLLETEGSQGLWFTLEAAESPSTTRGQLRPPHCAHVWPRPARSSASFGLPAPHKHARVSLLWCPQNPVTDGCRESGLPAVCGSEGHGGVDLNVDRVTIKAQPAESGIRDLRPALRPERARERPVSRVGVLTSRRPRSPWRSPSVLNGDIHGPVFRPLLLAAGDGQVADLGAGRTSGVRKGIGGPFCGRGCHVFGWRPLFSLSSITSILRRTVNRY